MNRPNYARQLDKLISQLGDSRPQILLHACCGPCSSSVIEKLNEHFDITILWYNPNIYPEEEYDRRYSALTELVEKMGLKDKINIIAEPWRNEDYEKIVVGLEKEPEGGKRCEKCFELRLMETARISKKLGFDYFCTTLTVSRHKNAMLINYIGESMQDSFNTKWLYSDFKKNDGENRSVELSEKYKIYRQLYCGCRYSLENREKMSNVI